MTSLDQFEKAIRARNPILAERLQAGLAEAKVRKMLQRVGVEGNSESIVQLFAWKDGSVLDPSVKEEHASPFPGSAFMFLDLDMMISHFKEYKECARYHPRYEKVAGRFFPLFWDGSDNWIALDLDQGRIVLLETQLEQMVRNLSDSLERFLKDAIRANEKDEQMIGFN